MEKHEEKRSPQEPIGQCRDGAQVIASIGDNADADQVVGVIFFGDSIFAGTGASDRQLGCIKRLKASLRVPISIRGRNRDTSAMGLRRLATDVLARRDYSHVVVLFANNDCWLNANGRPVLSPEQFGKNLRMIVSRIAANRQIPICCNLQPIDNEKFFATFEPYRNFRRNTDLDPCTWQEKYSEMITVICQEAAVPLIDIRAPLLAELPYVMASDGVHPNDRGHELIANRILEMLSRLDARVNGSSAISGRR